MARAKYYILGTQMVSTSPTKTARDKRKINSWPEGNNELVCWCGPNDTEKVSYFVT